MIDITAYKEKFDTAIGQKGNKKYSKKIAIELAKQEWQQQWSELERIFRDIKEKSDFEKYHDSLVKLFDDLYEVITAPGVDNFIGWINEITNDKNNTNTKKLRDYLVESYSMTNISETIESVNSNKSVLEIENSIFDLLLSEVKKELRKETTSFLNDPKQFGNNIDDYFVMLTSTLEGLTEVKELYYTSQDQLYTSEQKSNDIAFYGNLINTILDKGQSLKPQSEIEKSQSIISKVQNRITEINKGISILHKSNIASSQDELLNNIFLKLDKEINYEKGISNALNQFIDETWKEIENQYTTIKNFFNQLISISYNSSWDSFSKKGGIISLIDDYNSIIKENILSNILDKSIDEVLKLLKNKAKLIERYFEEEKTLKYKIVEEFKEKISEFGSCSKKQLLESLSKDNSTLLNIKQEIESNIEGLKSGITKLDERKELIKFLNDDFTYVLNNLSDIRSGFEKFLQQSGMSAHLAWLESKFDGSSNGVITTQDLNDPKLIKELLEKGLIKIEIEKTF